MIFADRGMARDHMRHLMREDGRKLGRVVGERNKTARDVKLPVGNAKALIAGELRIVTLYLRSGRSDEATSFVTTSSISGCSFGFS